MKMMIKKYSFFVFMLAALFSYGQGITFQKNLSPTASKLLVVQKLNKDGDSLILESDIKKIKQIDILNEDYLETIKVDSLKGKINLKNLPYGNYVIQARIDRHWIVMYMTKKNFISEGMIFSDIKIDTKLGCVGRRAKSLEVNTIPIQENSVENHLEENTMYWVVYESNSQFASVKTMGLKYTDEIYELISKIKLEVKSETGKNNKLFVYDVYDKVEFMRRQLRNRRYYKKEISKFFNVLPLLSFENENDKHLILYPSIVAR